MYRFTNTPDREEVTGRGFLIIYMTLVIIGAFCLGVAAHNHFTNQPTEETNG